ncbi:MAG: PAS domain-containing protein [Candidatus Electryoneaceae bacterium]|nr:PAS domain-containing protein [Candidatus Electryoneaceae bacterium]
MADDQSGGDLPPEYMDDLALSPEQFRIFASELARTYKSEREKREQLELAVEELQERTEQLLEEIRQRKLADAKIQEQAALLDIAPSAVLVCDLNNKILYTNPAAREMYGRNRVINNILMVSRIPQTQCS